MNRELKTADDVKKFLEENDLPENFCIIPFINIILGPGGDVSICRQKGSKHIVGSLKTDSLENIWNNEYMQKWRNEFLEGKPEICSKETKYVHCHLSPEHYWDYEAVSRKTIQKYPFKKLTANLNGECNLKCVMCDVWKQENGFYDNDAFWSNAREEIMPFIKEVEMLSGEPLIQEDTFKLIDQMSEVNPKAVWSITTNGIWDFEGRVEQYLKKIKIKRFIFSIDSLDPERYSKIRINGDLHTLVKNVEKIIGLSEKVAEPFEVTIHFLIMTSNYDEIAEVVRRTRSWGAKLTLDICEHPQNLSIFKFPEEKRLEIAKSLLEETPPALLSSVMAVILRIVSSLSSVRKKEMLLNLLDKKSVL